MSSKVRAPVGLYAFSLAEIVVAGQMASNAVLFIAHNASSIAMAEGPKERPAVPLLRRTRMLKREESLVGAGQGHLLSSLPVVVLRPERARNSL